MRPKLGRDLVRAAETGDIETVLALLDSGADVNAEDGHMHITALMQAAAGGHVETMRLLLERGARADPNLYGHSSLEEAINSGSPEAVRLLIARGANINQKEGEHEVTHLMAAAEVGEVAIVQMLIDAGAEVNACDWMNRTALTYARNAKNAPVVDLLKRAGAEESGEFVC